MGWQELREEEEQGLSSGLSLGLSGACVCTEDAVHATGAHTLPTHPIPTLSTHPINTSYQHTISTHPTDTTKNTTPCKQIPYQPPTNTPYQPPLLMYLHRTVGLRRLTATSPARYFPSPPHAGKALVGSSARATGICVASIGRQVGR